MRADRRALEALDARLRAAVADRDEALAGLGQATLTSPAPERRAGDRIAAFADTLAGLDTERIAIDGRRETLTIELAAAEADRRARLAEFEGRRDALDIEAAAAERALGTQRRRLAELARADADEAALRRNLEGRLAHITDAEVHAEAEDGERSVFTEERPRIEARLRELDDAAAPRAERRAALTEPITRLEAQLTDIAARRDGLGTARAALLEATDARIAELRAAREEEVELLGRLDERRRAALVDLGREALHLDSGADPAMSAARASLEVIAVVRRERLALNARRAALDDRPIRRTLLGLLVVFVLLVALRAVLTGP
jgi:chromosome segregation ATPase